MRSLLFFVVLLVLISPAFAEVSARDQAEIQGMHWQKVENVPLGASKSSIGTMPGFATVVGQEARRLRQIVDGTYVPGIEAETLNPTTYSEVAFEWNPVGYVKDDDWSTVDPDSFLAQMKRQDDVNNVERKRRGVATVNTLGWRQVPTFNTDTHTISWSINGIQGDGTKVVNSVAVKLGRYGFERILWIVSPDKIEESNDLLTAVNSHRFDLGNRYVDYIQSTDRSAAYGVAGLVAGALGVKVLKGAGLVALVVFLKKFIILLFVPVIYLWRKFIGLFRKNNRDPSQITIDKLVHFSWRKL